MSDGVTVLPDGSAFATASWPLPKDHWLYAPRGEWDNERDDFAETPRPILTNAQREAVTAAARYAIRGATMCGQEQDFDPDALVQNLCYALCGPAGGATLAADKPRFTVHVAGPDDVVPFSDELAVVSQVEKLIAELAAANAELALRRKSGSASERLHNICESISKDADGSEWSREEWEKLDADMLALRKERDAANAVIDELLACEDLRIRAGKINPVEPGYEKEILMDEYRRRNRIIWNDARALRNKEKK